MDQEAPQFLFKRNALLKRLDLCLRRIHDDITKEKVGVFREITGKFVYRKRHDIRAVVDASVLSIKGPDFLGAGKEDAKFGPLKSQ